MKIKKVRDMSNEKKQKMLSTRKKILKIINIFKKIGFVELACFSPFYISVVQNYLADNQSKNSLLTSSVAFAAILGIPCGLQVLSNKFIADCASLKTLIKVDKLNKEEQKKNLISRKRLLKVTRIFKNIGFMEFAFFSQSYISTIQNYLIDNNTYSLEYIIQFSLLLATILSISGGMQVLSNKFTADYASLKTLNELHELKNEEQHQNYLLHPFIILEDNAEAEKNL